MSQTSVGNGDVRSILSRSATLVGETPLTLGLGLLGGFAVFVPIVWPVLVVLAFAGLIEVFARELGHQTRERSLVVRLVLAVLGAALLVVFIAFGGLFVVLPGVYVAIVTALTIPAIVIDSHGPLGAVLESVALARGNAIRIVAILGAVSLLAAPGLIVPAVVTVPGPTADVLLGFFGGVALTGWAAATATMYLTFTPTNVGSSSSGLPGGESTDGAATLKDVGAGTGSTDE
ncbi:hypothetical protein [Halococcoides cellulosivorans]|uniref:DUF4013 domain-containing protein n=1 Tax=Halococcoides cellulosivorans TaxID=1679096 RepID=A0A2R4WXT9_9EURY|nr:hypothetical protein [Halococcoides cellulosivorans]AWB26331.1 hypothetical protein HARCEL1_00640 [Halococcoides cellulosivorans]